MDKYRAAKIVDGIEPPDGTESMQELLALTMNCCYEDDGDLWCLKCWHPNECCICGTDEDPFYCGE